MSLFRAIYTSRPFGFDSAMLNGILADARRANQRDDVTGALICRADLYIQWLEGPEDKVRATIARIQRDHRHLEVRLHVQQAVSERAFAAWAMLDDPAATWIWTQDQVACGAIDRATPEDITAFCTPLQQRAAAPGGA